MQYNSRNELNKCGKLYFQQSFHWNKWDTRSECMWGNFNMRQCISCRMSWRQSSQMSKRNRQKCRKLNSGERLLNRWCKFCWVRDGSGHCTKNIHRGCRSYSRGSVVWGSWSMCCFKESTRWHSWYSRRSYTKCKMGISSCTRHRQWCWENNWSDKHCTPSGCIRLNMHQTWNYKSDKWSFHRRKYRYTINKVTGCKSNSY